VEGGGGKEEENTERKKTGGKNAILNTPISARRFGAKSSP